MRKIILLLLVLLVAFYASATASDKPTIGIFMEAPITFVNNETVRKTVPEKTMSFFPKNTFNVLPFDTTSMELRTYKEDNRMIVNQYFSKPVNREDIQKIAKGLNCDYALFIIISNDAPRVSAGLFSMSFRTTVTCDVRLLDVATGKYLTSKQIVKDGSSTAIYMGAPSFDNAYREALGKALDELTIDTSVMIKQCE
ncbi:hypothetical protein [Sporomusa malonica]|uniref:Uncharacterized protein n=1 Tax=Sporomusa malonica TaxID=112901 RepID=A0A1W2ASL4_9FIRM|nr:hypothetical protein [Sporomusa malonica]SMC63188.1 hypothetical protein SAMN04488500_10660 [Sporomusa malonica]